MTKKKHFRVYLPRIAGGILVAVVAGFIIYFISNLEPEKPAKKERKIQAISLTKPPPPPPPPPKVEKPPEPVEQKVEEAAEPEPEPEEMPDVAEAPPGDLGLDAEGTAGSDSFGLVGHKGGKGLFGGGSGGNPFAWYGTIIKNDILEVLSEKEELRRKGYTALVKVWIEADGSVKRFELVKGSNDSEIDELLNRMLARYKKVNEPPPPEMEQPVKLRITSRI